MFMPALLLSLRKRSTPIVVMSVSTMDIDDESGQFLVIVSSRAMILPSMKEFLPPTSWGTAYCPKAGMNVNKIAVVIPVLMLGRSTRKIDCDLVAPKSRAASMSEKSNFSIVE